MLHVRLVVVPRSCYNNVKKAFESVDCEEGQTSSAGRGLKFCAAITGLTLLALASAAQMLSPGEVRISSEPYQPQSQVLSAESRLVRVDAVVRDSNGQIVTGLKPEDFAVYDDGRKQAISSFVVETRQLRLPFGKAPAPAPAAAGAPSSLPPQVSPRPRYVALYFDDLHTPFGDTRHVQLAAENFMREGVFPGDKVALFTASGSQTVDFTSNASKVLDAIEKLKSHGRSLESATCPRITLYDAYLIANQLDPVAYQVMLGEAVQCNCVDQLNLEIVTCTQQQETLVQVESQQMWDSIRQMSQDTLSSVRATVDRLAEQPGERVLVLASSGFMTGTLEANVDDIIDRASQAGIVINALDAKGLITGSPNRADLDVDPSDAIAQHSAESLGPAMASATAAMVDFTVGTGGRFFHNRNDLGAGYYSLAAAPETQYLLGFVPDELKKNGGFHKLKVEVNAPEKVSVEARPGYFAGKEASGPTAEQKIDAEVRGSGEGSDFPVAVSEKPATAPNGAPEFNVETHVDIRKLPFERQNDRYVDMLTFVDALFDAQGKMVVGKEAQMRFALKPETYERFSRSGINGGMSFAVPPGTYRLRVVVEEALHGEMSATSQNLQVR